MSFLQAMIMSVFATATCAQNSISGAVVDQFNIDPEASVGFSEGSIIVAPIPLADPTIGNGLVIVGGYLFQADVGSSTSYLGLGALKTDGGSLGYGLSGKLYLDSNRWQFGFSAGRVELDYDLYVLGKPVPLRQNGNLVNITGAYGLTPEFSVGLDLRYINSELEFDQLVVDKLANLLDVEIFNVGITLDWDRRDDTIYPTNGTHVYFLATQGIILKGLINNFEKAILKFDAYKTVFNNNVIALRAVGCASSSSAPFFDSCALGGVDAFRGYPVTQFIDNRLLSVQAAWRGEFTDRLGYSVFAGAGVVGPSIDGLWESDVQTAVGVGARYRLSKDFHMTFSVDGTINSAGEKLLYVYIGQRF